LGKVEKEEEELRSQLSFSLVIHGADVHMQWDLGKLKATGYTFKDCSGEKD
jgi:hypothetical protein